LSLKQAGEPIAGAVVAIMDKYDPANQVEARLDPEGKATLTGFKPGAYRLQAGAGSYEFLLNRDEKLSVDFRPGLELTLGRRPIIEWKEGMQQP